MHPVVETLASLCSRRYIETNFARQGFALSDTRGLLNIFLFSVSFHKNYAHLKFQNQNLIMLHF